MQHKKKTNNNTKTYPFRLGNQKATSPKANFDAKGLQSAKEKLKVDNLEGIKKEKYDNYAAPTILFYSADRLKN